jgi:hypothetical protein
MAQIKNKGIENNAVDGLKIRLSNNQAIRARNAANSADIDLLKLNASNKPEFGVAVSMQEPSAASDGATKNYVDTTVANYVPLSQKGAANGVATLGADSKIPSAQIPPIALVDVNVVANNTARDALTVQEGDVANTTDSGKWWIYDGAAWLEIASTGAVSSVNSQTGTVVLDSDDISEGATNLYHTVARARAAAVLNTLAGSETDQAGSVAAVNSALSAKEASLTFMKQTFVLVAQDITNQYIELSHVAKPGSIALRAFGIEHAEGVDYTLSQPASVTRITFAGDLATGGAAALIATDTVRVSYARN